MPKRSAVAFMLIDALKLEPKLMYTAQPVVRCARKRETKDMSGHPVMK